MVAIYDASCNFKVKYLYDAWGNCTIAPETTDLVLANANPIRYRGYYYDSDTGLYYLNSRYYSPKWRRFINADSFVSTGQGILGNNMFAYCRNDPVTRTDISGTTDEEADKVSLDEGDIDDDMFGGPRGGGGGGTVGGNSTNGYSTSGYSYASNSGAKVNWNSSVSNSQCFVAGTLIKAANGDIPIEEIQAGDHVWAWDEKTGEVALKQVVETYRSQTRELIHIFVSGEEIITTPSHPFYSPVKGWTDAAHLRAGDILMLLNGEYVVVEKVQHEILEAPITVYNFQVEDYHTYYVSSAGVLVHNSCGEKLKIYNSVKQSPEYNPDFQKVPNGTKKFNINNASLHAELNQYGSGWKKVYSDGYLWGYRASMHYFQDSSGKVFNVKYVEGWSVIK